MSKEERGALVSRARRTDETSKREKPKVLGNMKAASAAWRTKMEQEVNTHEAQPRPASTHNTSDAVIASREPGVVEVKFIAASCKTTTTT